eukprot:TRINITY_DN2437_c0_g1_i3.p1 TRINITY_DN2437_c0_g1~~TRINITY_DN2437_c0_g1_i3.p1  ORF type:complete len:119 (+),score=49.19 TRINITY_DN2437_c0_g1_i3:71-427(+)
MSYATLLLPHISTSFFFFFLMIRRPPRSTLSSSSAASDVYKRQLQGSSHLVVCRSVVADPNGGDNVFKNVGIVTLEDVVAQLLGAHEPVSYTHLRAHETPEHLVCRLLLEKKKKKTKQ